MPHRLTREIAVWGGLAGVALVSLSQGRGYVPALATLSFAYTPACVLLVLGLAAGPSALGRALATPVLTPLAEASYSLYLVHWLPLMFLLNTPGVHTTTAVAVTAIVASVALSVGLFYCLEDPCRRLMKPTRVKAVTTPVLTPTPMAMPAAA